MKLIWIDKHEDRDGAKVILLFGAGLIGSSIVENVQKNLNFEVEDCLFDWNNMELRVSQSAIIQRKILENEAPLNSLEVIWSAGRAGFSANVDELMQESCSFEDVLRLSGTLAELLPWVRHRFHLISSAGGLFEGQRLVNRNSKPKPMRPYGIAKLQQEDLLRELPANILCSIYRPSSVYGRSLRGGRSGLISVLADNALRHRISHIYGNINTLRDYVFVGDIGKFITSRLFQEGVAAGNFVLASSKPTTIAEIIQTIERAIICRLKIRFDNQAWNADHISFSSEVLPMDWQPTSLETGVRITLQTLSTRGW